MAYLILLAAVVWLAGRGFKARSAAWAAKTPEQRAFTVRFTLFCGILSFLFLVAALFLPNKGRVVLMLPIFLAGASLVRWWHDARERLRRKAAADEQFARARRIN